MLCETALSKLGQRMLRFARSQCRTEQLCKAWITAVSPRAWRTQVSVDDGRVYRAHHVVQSLVFGQPSLVIG